MYYKESFFNNERCLDSVQALVEEMPVIIKNLDKMLGTSVILIDLCHP